MEKFDPQIHHRRSIRLKGYDYSQAGAYFVTMVAWQREALFGEIVNGEIELNRYGQIVLNAWFDLPRHYRYVELRAFVVMPNHVHGIVILDGNGRGGSVGNYSEPDKTIAGKSLVPEVTQTRP